VLEFFTRRPIFALMIAYRAVRSARFLDRPGLCADGSPFSGVDLMREKWTSCTVQMTQAPERAPGAPLT
jgi:hypothetical protein